MGFPKGYTSQCWGKQRRSSDPVGFDHVRHSLIGNAWSVGVVSCLLEPLAVHLGLVPFRGVKVLQQQLLPGGSHTIVGKLLREDFVRRTPYVSIPQGPDDAKLLVSKLSHLVSPKGTDVLLSSNSEPLPSSHKLRTSLNPKLWVWRAMCGWKWRAAGQSQRDHINLLELRAVETSLRWHIFRAQNSNRRVLHLVDSMVSLRIINKGRTSARKLRAVCKRIGALQLSSGIQLVLAYTNTKTNPADAPSRASTKRKWANAL